MFRASGPIIYISINCEVKCLKKRKKRRVKGPVQFKTEPDIFTESDNNHVYQSGTRKIMV